MFNELIREEPAKIESVTDHSVDYCRNHGRNLVVYVATLNYLSCHPRPQWHSRTFGRSGRWSNLLPFRLRFWKLASLESFGKSHVMSTVTLVYKLAQQYVNWYIMQLSFK